MSDEQNPREEMRSRALRAMITDAFFRWESAVTIALTMLLAFFGNQIIPDAQWWYFVLGGMVAEAAFILAYVTDPKAAAAAVARMFVEKYDPRDIKNRVQRERMLKALEYRESIAQIVAGKDGAMRVSAQQTLDEIDTWIANIYRLARRLDAFEEDSILQRDLKSVPNDLAALRRRLDTVQDSATVRAEVEESIRLKEQQYANLQTAAENMTRAELQLQNTLAALGTIYAQMQVIDSKDLDSGRARRLRDEIHDEVAELQDTILAMDEVYSAGRLVD